MSGTVVILCEYWKKVYKCQREEIPRDSARGFGYKGNDNRFVRKMWALYLFSVTYELFINKNMICSEMDTIFFIVFYLSTFKSSSTVKSVHYPVIVTLISQQKDKH